MPKFRRKPVVIEAEQYSKQRHIDEGYLPPGVSHGYFADGDGARRERMPEVHTIHNNQVVRIEDGDWIIPEPDGIHFYPCKSDIFEATYEPVEA